MGARAAKFRAYAFFEHARIVARTVATPAATCRRGNAGRPVGEISSRRVEAVASLAAGAGHLIAHQRATPPAAVRIEHEHERGAGSGADEHTSRIHEISSSRSTRNTGTRKAGEGASPQSTWTYVVRASSPPSVYCNSGRPPIC